MTSSILILNAGSSSIKFALYEVPSLAPICQAAIEDIGHSARLVSGWDGADDLLARIGIPPPAGDHDALTVWLLKGLRRASAGIEIVAAGHRVVHGGQAYADPVLLVPSVVAALEKLIPLAPNHQPHNFALIAAISRHWPHMPQVACFDTAFHRTQPRIAQLFALPLHLTDEGIVRYGFHGLSYDYIASVLPDIAGPRADGRIIVAHLGHGASMCAMKERRSVATTMGFTALDGLVMGTRCGALDPGVVLHLLLDKGMTASQVSRLLNNRSGLLGVSGLSSDVRDLQASKDPRAKEALDLFNYRATRAIGSLTAALSGLDGLVFTAGIGANSASIRKAICDGLSWLGIALDQSANAQHRTRINAQDSSVDIFVIPTDEEIVIARATQAVALLGEGRVRKDHPDGRQRNARSSPALEGEL
jgi:acetate kinase